MVKRTESGTTYTQNFDTENRITSIVTGSQTTTFVYDGDGVLTNTKLKPSLKTTARFAIEASPKVGCLTGVCFKIAAQAPALKYFPNPFLTSGGNPLCVISNCSP
jgi:YD repeat-containing protein